MKLISVIIPVYNHAGTILKCLESVRLQSYRPLEVIIVNDGSTDNFVNATSKIFSGQKYLELNIKLISQENGGAPSARNRGYKEAKGEYVIFWDADTVAKPDMLAKMADALEKNTSAAYAYSQFKFGWKTMGSHAFDPELLKKNNYIDTTSLIRKSDYDTCAMKWDESLKRFQDWDLWLTFLEKNKTGVFIPEVLYTKQLSSRIGISNWLPSFVFRLPFKTGKVKKYEAAKSIVMDKHLLCGEHGCYANNAHDMK